MTANQNEKHEEYVREWRPTVDIFDTAICFIPGAVEHYFVPIFAGREGEKQQEGVKEVFEVLYVTVYDVSLDYARKEEITQDWEHEINQHQQQEYITQSWNRESNGL